MNTTLPPTYEQLASLVITQSAQITHLQHQIIVLEAEVETLRKGPPVGSGKVVPAFVKANKPTLEAKTRLKRLKNSSRRKDTPTKTITHEVKNCPKCQRKLTFGWLHRTRQVIEIPEVRYEVVEHRMMRAKCGVCGTSTVAKPDLSQEVVGKHRVGVRLMSFIVTLKKMGRMTVRSIHKLLKSMYGLHLSLGAITELLHDVAELGAAFYEKLKGELLESPYVHADETSWRENGHNHWVWSFSTPDVRLIEINKSRGHLVPKLFFGDQWHGVLCSDFYPGYSYYLGEHQKCWVHYLRDIKELMQKHPHDGLFEKWSNQVSGIWKAAKEFNSKELKERVQARRSFQNELVALARPYIGKEDGFVFRVLANRIINHSNQMFTFVEYENVPPDNNPAERAIRPMVIYRKVTGGSRTTKGSQTTAVLMSCLMTWQVRGLDPIKECVKMITETKTK